MQCTRFALNTLWCHRLISISLFLIIFVLDVPKLYSVGSLLLFIAAALGRDITVLGCFEAIVTQKNVDQFPLICLHCYIVIHIVLYLVKQYSVVIK